MSEHDLLQINSRIQDTTTREKGIIISRKMNLVVEGKGATRNEVSYTARMDSGEERDYSEPGSSAPDGTVVFEI